MTTVSSAPKLFRDDMFTLANVYCTVFAKGPRVNSMVSVSRTEYELT